MATYDLKYPGAAIDAILDTAYDLQNAGYIFKGSATAYSGTPTQRTWLLAPAGFSGYGFSSAIPKGSIGICKWNGSAWSGDVINVVTIDNYPTYGSTNAVTSGGMWNALDDLGDGIWATLQSFVIQDGTASANQGTQIKFDVKMTDGQQVQHLISSFGILAATTTKAGLMSAADKAKVDAFLDNLRSLSFTDTTPGADAGTKIVETLKMTVDGVQEAVTALTILAATTSKAGLMSATDKAYIDGLPTSLSTISTSISNLLAMLGYYECSTAAATAAKEVSASGYALTNGGCIRIKMTNANTANNVTLNINSTGAKALYYDGAQASATNTWEAGEVLEVYYDGTQYQCASGGGGKFATGEKVKDTDIVTSLQSGSNGLPTAGGVYNALEPLKQAVSQLNEQVLVKFDYTLESGKYYNGSGYTTNAYFCSTSPIDVTGKDKIYVGATTTSASGVKTIYFINNGAVISSEMYTTLEKYKEVTLPAGTTHVILNTMVSTCHYPVVLYSTAGASRLDEIDEIAEDVYTTGQETIEYTTVDGFLSGDGTSVTSHNGYSTTDYIDVSSIDSVLVSATTASISGTVYGYDENKNAMFWLLGKGTYTSQQVDIPATVKYIRVNGSTSGLAVRKITYTPTSDSFQAQIDQIKADIYTAYKEILYDESQNRTGFWGKNGVSFKSYGGFTATPFIAVTPASIIYVSTKVTNAGIYCCFAYDNNQNFLGVLLQGGTYNLEEIQLADNVAYIKMNGQGVIPKVYKKGVGFDASKKELNRNVNWVGMSIWWYDGRTLGGTAEVGGGVTAKGYQYLLKEQFKFLSDTGTSYCVSGASLGGTSESDSLSIAANMSSWAESANSIWTLDTITNDFRRNIPIGTTDDYNNDTGVTTYFGALRKFADKVATLSGSDAIVIVSNSLRRNNSGYTSTSQNGNGDTLESFERALMYVVMKNNWYFVDQFRLSALSDNVLPYATLDGLHCNNTGYRLAVLPWIAVFDEIYNRFL